MRKGGVIGVLVVVGAAILMILGGCGGDEETSAFTKGEYTKQANQICEEGSRRMEAEFRVRLKDVDLSSAAQKEELATEALTEPYGEMVDELEDLAAPQGDEEQVEAILEEMRQANQELEGDPLVVFEGSQATMFDKANQLALQYGLTGCALTS